MSSDRVEIDELENAQHINEVANRIREGRLNTLSKHEDIDHILNSFEECAARYVKSRNDLVWFAAAGRLYSSMKGQRPRIRSILQRISKHEISDAQGLNNNRDREYVALTLTVIRDNWVTTYAARQLVREEQAQNARELFATALFLNAIDLADALRHVRREFLAWSQGVENTDKRLRRLRWIVASLRSALENADPVPGTTPGDVLNKIVMAPDGEKNTSSRAARLECAYEIIEFVYQLTRARFSITASADTYHAIYTTQKWFYPAGFPEELREPVKKVQHVLVEGLELLAREGATSRVLKNAIQHVLGIDAAKAELKKVAERNPGLDDHVVNWLKGSSVYARKASQDAVEANDQRLDPHLAQVLLRLKEVEYASSTLGDLTDLADMYDEPLGRSARQLKTQMEKLFNDINTTLKLRGLEVEGVVGETIEYDPLRFGAATEIAQGQRVRVTSPAVVRKRSDRHTQVVRKGQVETVQE